MNSKIFLCVVLSTSSFCLHSSYVVRGPSGPLEVDYEVELPKEYKSEHPISSGCFSQVGSVLALSAGKTVMLYRMGLKKEENGSFVRAPGQFFKRFHFKSPITSVALDDSSDTFYAYTTSRIVSRVNWATGIQQNLEVSHLSTPLKISPFKNNFVSISGGNGSLVYNGSTDKIVLRREHVTSDEYTPFFTWRLEDGGPGQSIIRDRVDYVQKGVLCANCPGVTYPVIKTGTDKHGKSRLVLIDKEKKESYRSLSGIVTSLTRSPDSNMVVVGYEDGDMEIIDLTIFVARWKYNNIRAPFFFNPYGTLLVGIRGQKFVMISTARSTEENALIKQSLVLASIYSLEQKAAMQNLLSAFQPIQEKKTKKSKSGGKKKKKNRRKRK